MWIGRTGWRAAASGHDAVRAYWQRQFELIDSRVEPLRFEVDAEGRVLVDVHQVVRDLAGELVSDVLVRHVYTFDEGLVTHVAIREHK
jgi:hypothetical protein